MGRCPRQLLALSFPFLHGTSLCHQYCPWQMANLHYTWMRTKIWGAGTLLIQYGRQGSSGCSTPKWNAVSRKPQRSQVSPDFLPKLWCCSDRVPPIVEEVDCTCLQGDSVSLKPITHQWKPLKTTIQFLIPDLFQSTLPKWQNFAKNVIFFYKFKEIWTLGFAHP